MVKKDMKQEQAYREDYEKSYFYQAIWGDEGWLTTQSKRDVGEKLYKTVDVEVILDNEFNTADIAIYLALLKLSSFTKNYHVKVSSTQIREVSGILKQNQSRSIKKLQEKGIIKVLIGRYENSFEIIKKPNRFLPLKFSQFDGLVHDRKTYVRRLRAILLSNGNGKVPSYNNCKKKMGGKLTRVEHRNMKAIYGDHKWSEDDVYDEDFHQYLQLAF